MKTSENYPVNEWNTDTARLGYETVWPWDVVVPRSSGTRETGESSMNEGTVMTQVEFDHSRFLQRESQRDSIASA